MYRPSFKRGFAAAVALIAWCALILQYVLLIGATSGGIGPLLGTLRFFSFFTILSNLLVALTTTFALVRRRSRSGDFFATPRVRAAAALCIGITLGIYFFLLASTWAPQGAQWLADVTLHYAVPVFYLAWWVSCVPHGQLAWSDVLRWAMFPLVYLGFILLRGAWLHEYPYPFIDVDALGAGTVARNAVGIGLLFLLSGLVLVAVDRWLRRSA
jgi:hypothetical protein